MRRLPRRFAAVLIVVTVAVVAASSPRDRAAPESDVPAPPRESATPTVSPKPNVSAVPDAPAASGATDPNQDVQDSDPQLAARLRRPLERRPAFQGLPFSGDGIAVDFVGAARRGRVKLVVRHAGSRAAARLAYRRFLAYWRDDGRGYVVRYRRAYRRR